jgi:hypothetical protein
MSQRAFYQLLDYAGDVGLRYKLGQWKENYDYSRPHAAHTEKTPYAMLKLQMLGYIAMSG